MVQITLQFATLEAARAALLEIPSSVLAAKPVVAAASPKPAAVPEAAFGKATAEDDVVPTKTVDEKTPPAPSVETPAPASTAATVDYPTLQKAVFALAGKSREAAGAVAAELGVKTFKELTEDKWADALVAVNAALAETV